MTDEELAEIEGRANNATPGPWWVERPHTWKPQPYRTLDDFIAYSPFGEQGRSDPAHIFDLMEKYDVDTDYEFIAHARTDIPALIAEIRRLRRRAGRESEAGAPSK